MTTITLALLSARAVDEVRAADDAADVIDSGAAGTASMLRGYLLGQGVDLGDARNNNKVFDDACDALRAAYRSQYCNRVRKGVNMVLAREVLDATAETRATWTDGSEQKKIWNKIQHFGRTKLQRVCDVIWTPAPTESDGAGKAKKAPTPDAILANIDAFLASNPAPALIATLFDQIAARRPK
jgi:hypothetical protein